MQNQDESAQNENQIAQFQVYARRWLVLLAFSAVQFGNVMQFVTYSPIWNQAADFYSIKPEDMQWFGNMYLITFFILAPFCVKPVLARFDVSLMVVALISAVGTWIVWIAGQSFFWALVGFFFIGITDAMVLILPVFIADKWFSVYERCLATSIGSFAQYIGMAYGYAFASFYFKDVLDAAEFNHRVSNMNFMVAIINSLAFAITLILVQNRPPTPSSNSDVTLQLSQMLPQETIMRSIQIMFSEEAYVLDLLSLGIFIGVGWIYTTIISIQLYPFGFLQTEIAINGTIYQISGIIIGFWAAFRVDTQVQKGIAPDYDKYIRILTTLGMISLVLEAFIINFLAFWQLLILNFFIGVGLNAFYPLAIQAYVEKLYPANQLILVTGLLSFANFLGFVLNYILVLPDFLDYGLWIGVVCITPAYLHILLNLKTKFKRFESEM